MTSDEINEFWSNVNIGAPEECWEWKKKTLTFKGKRCSRIAFELGTGEDLGEFFACHSCDNSPCCNPAHLFRGTAKDNSDDMRRKGRWQMSLEGRQRIGKMRTWYAEGARADKIKEMEAKKPNPRLAGLRKWVEDNKIKTWERKRTESNKNK